MIETHASLFWVLGGFRAAKACKEPFGVDKPILAELLLHGIQVHPLFLGLSRQHDTEAMLAFSNHSMGTLGKDVFGSDMVFRFDNGDAVDNFNFRGIASLLMTTKSESLFSLQQFNGSGRRCLGR